MLGFWIIDCDKEGWIFLQVSPLWLLEKEGHCFWTVFGKNLKNLFSFFLSKSHTWLQVNRRRRKRTEMIYISDMWWKTKVYFTSIWWHSAWYCVPSDHKLEVRVALACFLTFSEFVEQPGVYSPKAAGAFITRSTHLQKGREANKVSSDQFWAGASENRTWRSFSWGRPAQEESAAVRQVAGWAPIIHLCAALQNPEQPHGDVLGGKHDQTRRQVALLLSQEIRHLHQTMDDLQGPETR